MSNFTEKTKNRIKEIIADKLGFDLEEVNDDDNLKDNLCADSLDTVELIMEFEKEFEIDIPDEDYENVEIVSDYYPIIEKYI